MFLYILQVIRDTKNQYKTHILQGASSVAVAVPAMGQPLSPLFVSRASCHAQFSSRYVYICVCICMCVGGCVGGLVVGQVGGGGWMSVYVGEGSKSAFRTCFCVYVYVPICVFSVFAALCHILTRVQPYNRHNVQPNPNTSTPNKTGYITKDFEPIKYAQPESPPKPKTSKLNLC